MIHFSLSSQNGSAPLTGPDMANCFGLTALISSLEEILSTRSRSRIVLRHSQLLHDLPAEGFTFTLVSSSGLSSVQG
jgi:hypothetical protein